MKIFNAAVILFAAVFLWSCSGESQTEESTQEEEVQQQTFVEATLVYSENSPAEEAMATLQQAADVIKKDSIIDIALLYAGLNQNDIHSYSDNLTTELNEEDLSLTISLLTNEESQDRDIKFVDELIDHYFSWEDFMRSAEQINAWGNMEHDLEKMIAEIEDVGSDSAIENAGMDDLDNIMAELEKTNKEFEKLMNYDEQITNTLQSGSSLQVAESAHIVKK